MTIKRSHDRSDRGQIIPLFALMLVVVIAMVGLVLDGGSTYVQKRTQQSASDLSALAGANAWLVDTNSGTRIASAITAARAVAAQAGYVDGVGGQVVNVTTAPYGAGIAVKVDIGAPHPNTFAAVIPGFQSWDVSSTATAAAGIAGSARGAAPVMFRAEDFVDGRGLPLPKYSDPLNPFSFEGPHSNDDFPATPDGTAWTTFASPDNLDTNTVHNIIYGTDTLVRTFNVGDYIGQHNQGGHTALFSDLDDVYAGHDLGVPIVDGAGRFQGWAIFHLVSASGGSSKSIVGYFISGFSESLDICKDPGDCPNSYGAYVLKLID